MRNVLKKCCIIIAIYAGMIILCNPIFAKITTVPGLMNPNDVMAGFVEGKVRESLNKGEKYEGFIDRMDGNFEGFREEEGEKELIFEGLKKSWDPKKYFFIDFNRKSKQQERLDAHQKELEKVSGDEIRKKRVVKAESKEEGSYTGSIGGKKGRQRVNFFYRENRGQDLDLDPDPDPDSDFDPIVANDVVDTERMVVVCGVEKEGKKDKKNKKKEGGDKGEGGEKGGKDKEIKAKKNKDGLMFQDVFRFCFSLLEEKKRLFINGSYSQSLKDSFAFQCDGLCFEIKPPSGKIFDIFVAVMDEGSKFPTEPKEEVKTLSIETVEKGIKESCKTEGIEGCAIRSVIVFIAKRIKEVGASVVRLRSFDYGGRSVYILTFNVELSLDEFAKRCNKQKEILLEEKEKRRKEEMEEKWRRRRLNEDDDIETFLEEEARDRYVMEMWRGGVDYESDEDDDKESGVDGLVNIAVKWAKNFFWG